MVYLHLLLSQHPAKRFFIMTPLEFFTAHRDNEPHEIQSAFALLNKETRDSILLELPRFIKDTLESKNYTLLKKLTCAFFVKKEQFVSIMSTEESLGREACIFALIMNRPEPGLEQSALIDLIKLIMKELMNEVGLRLEIIADRKGVDRLNLCVFYFPELFDILLVRSPPTARTFDSTRSRHCFYGERSDLLATHCWNQFLGSIEKTNEFIPRRFFMLGAPKTSDHILPVDFCSEYNNTLHAAIFMFNKDSTAYPEHSFIRNKRLYASIIRNLVNDQKSKVYKLNMFNPNCERFDGTETGSQLDQPDNFSITPLMYAASLGDKETVRYLISRGADINCTTSKGTALFYALLYNKDETIVELLRHDAQLNRIPNWDYQRPFFLYDTPYYNEVSDEQYQKEQKKLAEFKTKRPYNIAANARADHPFMLPNGYHLVERPVLGDGDCLYHAVALHDVQARSAEVLRECVASYIADGHLNEFLKDEDPTSYALRVRQGLWGGQIEIRALMNILARPIVVINQNGQAPIRPEDTTVLLGEPIFISYNGRDHYNGLSPVDGYTARDIYSIHLPIIESLQTTLCSDIVRSVFDCLQFSEICTKFSFYQSDAEIRKNEIPSFSRILAKRKVGKLEKACSSDKESDEDESNSLRKAPRI